MAQPAAAQQSADDNGPARARGSPGQGAASSAPPAPHGAPVSDAAALPATAAQPGSDVQCCAWAWLGRVDYSTALARQRALLEARAAGALPDTLLLLEHPPVLTLGRRGSRNDVLVSEAALAARGIVIHETNRGGLVTYHGPGQLVAYPIADIRSLTGGDVVRYVWGLEESVIRVLANLGIVAGRDAQHRGCGSARRRSRRSAWRSRAALRCTASRSTSSQTWATSG